jgi:GWxTD domain-containing protein
LPFAGPAGRAISGRFRFIPLSFFPRLLYYRLSDCIQVWLLGERLMRLKAGRQLFFFGLSLFLAFSFQGFAEKKAVKDLPLKYKQWLEEEVVYIITPLEKDVFLRLETDRERDLFIEAFWKQRDPTPGTPLNEFREAHYQRIRYANRTFGRTTPLPGWKTDRGRLYIILGEPNDIERFTGEAEVYNTEVWFYQGLTKYGLPAGFYLVFYQKGGVGDYVLYSPTADGPQALLTTYWGDQANYLQAYRKLKQASPGLANVSLSLIPGESSRFGRPSLSSDILLQNIQTIPTKEVKDGYAQKFLLYKDVIEVEYTANYIDSDSLVRVFRDASGLYSVHYCIELNRFSVREQGGTYSTNLKLNGQVSDRNGKTIYQYEESLPVKLNQDQLKNITYKPFELYDRFPLVPGSYKFSVLLKNEASQEFTSVEKDIVVPEDESSPRLSGLVMGYKTEDGRGTNLKPFRLGGAQVLCQPSRIFQRRDTLFLNFQVLGRTAELGERGAVQFDIFRQEERVLSVTKRVSDYGDKLDILEEFPLADFPPGLYRLEVSLRTDDRVWGTEREHFEITPVSALPRPWVFSRTLLAASHPAYSYAVGRQYFNQGRFDQALAPLERAHAGQPNSEDYALALARLYLLLGENGKAKETLAPFSASPDASYEVYVSLGQAHQRLGEFDEAIAVFNRALSRFGTNTSLLNALGESYYGRGDLEEALAAWTRSLSINPDQEEIKQKVASIKKDGRTRPVL